MLRCLILNHKKVDSRKSSKINLIMFRDQRDPFRGMLKYFWLDMIVQSRN